MADLETSESMLAYYTEKGGDISRQLGFAGLALVWLFHTTTKAGATGTAVALDEGFKLPVTLIVISLGIDALQYLICGALWLVAFRRDPTSKAQQAGINRSANYTALSLVGIKLVIMGGAYILLLAQIACGPLWGTPP